MSRAYDMWIHRQLEPTDIIITGNRKRYSEIKKELVLPLDQDKRTVLEIEQMEDGFLAAHGINISPKQKL